MQIYSYDKTFEGFLTLVFEAYENKCFPQRIVDYKSVQSSIFAPSYRVHAQEEKAKRVYNSLKTRLHKSSFNMIYHVFLSEIDNCEMLLLQYIRLVFESKVQIEADFRNETVLKLLKYERKIVREAQRIQMFIRFQKTIDDVYFAPFDPQYNVLPLVIPHFKDRFSDQKWIIYDTRRNYGYYYNLKEYTEMTLDSEGVDLSSGKIKDELLASEEKELQCLWKSYFDNIAIKERRNLKLHVQFLPKRFWKYLPEKQRTN